MSNFIAKISIAEFLSNFKVSEFEHELEPGDLAYDIQDLWKNSNVTPVKDIDTLDQIIN